jgi:hypothetical protein
VAEAAKIFTGKFNRRYVLRVETPKRQSYVTITMPLTIEFNVVRNNLASANTANFVIYNLSSKTRDLLYKDQFDTSEFRAIQLFAGYDDSKAGFLSRVFNGFIKMAGSHRDGSTWKTEIEAYDGYLAATSNVTTTLPAGTPLKDQILNLMNSFSNIQEKVIGNDFEEGSKRGIALMGDPMDALRQITQGKVYIDDQKAYALGPNDVVPSEIRLISSDNGLLGTPKKHQNLIEIEMLFEPRIKPSQLLELKSSGEKKYNGVYKVTGITHKGIMSDAVSGDCKTTLQMLQIKDWKVVYDSATKQYIAGAP